MLYWLMPGRMIAGHQRCPVHSLAAHKQENQFLSHPFLFHSMSSARAPRTGEHLILICYLICGLLVMVQSHGQITAD